MGFPLQNTSPMEFQLAGFMSVFKQLLGQHVYKIYMPTITPALEATAEQMFERRRAQAFLDLGRSPTW